MFYCRVQENHYMELSKEIYSIFFALITAFVVTYSAIPSIIKVTCEKGLYDKPGERTAHKFATPTLGGLAIFAGIILAFTSWCDISKISEIQFFIPATIIIFFIGLKDDILIIAPTTKMGGQLAAGLLISIPGDIRFTSLHGFYGITDIPYFASILLTLFVIIVIINGFNLIDGIDGLSSGVGILTSTSLGIWFTLAGHYQYALLAFSLTGALLAFFRFNVFSVKRKIFMGDTGSLLVGLILSVLIIRFNELNIFSQQKYAIHAAPAVSFGILIIPLFDILRVMFIRLVLLQSPFKADKNHIHHRLLDLGLSHLQATLVILGVNLAFIIFVFLASPHFEILRLVLILLILGMIFSFIPVYLNERKNKVKIKEKDE